MPKGKGKNGPKKSPSKPTRRQSSESLSAQNAKAVAKELEENFMMSCMAAEALPVLLAPLIDPYATMLLELIEQRQPKSTSDPLLQLHVLHRRVLQIPDETHPIDADAALLLAGEVGIQAPAWAVDLARKVRLEKYSSRDMDLNKTLGFTAEGKGRTAEIERRARVAIVFRSMLNILGLRLIGVSMEDACMLEAGRMQRLGKSWNKSAYDMVPDLGSHVRNPEKRDSELRDKRSRYAEKLRQEWYAWKSPMKDSDSPESIALKTDIEADKAKFLAQFPPL